jgi:ATP-binding cassette, subfamily C (CFTR/MRP), member 2
MNMLVAMIYEKHAKISDATNKEFESGEIVNFVQVDAERIFWLCYSISSVAKIPFVFLVAFVAFFWYFGWCFLSGLSVVLLAVIVQSQLGVWLSRVQKRVMETKDARMKVTTEALTNTKMLKLYSWQKNFIKRIWRRRQKEVVQLRIQGFGYACMISLLYLFPNLLPAVVFTTFIGFGN